MIVGFNNMIVYGVYESDKHYVITVSEDLDEDMDDIPEHFLHTKETSLFEIVTLKPTTTTTTSTTESATSDPLSDATSTSEPFVTSEASTANEYTTVVIGTDD